MPGSSHRKLLNGIDVDRLFEEAAGVQDAPEGARFVFRTRSRWLGGGRSRTLVETGPAPEGRDRPSPGRPFVLEADGPEGVLGEGRAPDPVEHLLHAVGSCLAMTLAYWAAARGVSLGALEVEVRAALDLRSLLGATVAAPPRVEELVATVRVGTSAPRREIERVARQACRSSPVLSLVAAAVTLRLEITGEPGDGAPRDPETETGPKG